jgi:hypothetical protein
MQYNQLEYKYLSRTKFLAAMKAMLFAWSDPPFQTLRREFTSAEEVTYTKSLR